MAATGGWPITRSLTAALAALNRAVVQQGIDAMNPIEHLLQHPDDLPREVFMSSDRGAWRARMLVARMIKYDGRPPGNDLTA